MSVRIPLLRPAALLTAAFFALSAAEPLPPVAPGGWRIDFGACPLAKDLPVGWEFRAGKPFVTDTAFAVELNERGERVMVVTADRATGMVIGVAGGDLKRCPILRWKWRARNLPKGADSRVPEKDDQVLAIYMGAGGALHRKSISYRWDTDTPIGTEGKTNYAGGLVSAFYRTICNRETPVGEWRIDEADVAADFERQYGFLPAPERFIIGVAANSQHTDSMTIGEVAWIELVPRHEEK